MMNIVYNKLHGGLWCSDEKTDTQLFIYPTPDTRRYGKWQPINDFITCYTTDVLLITHPYLLVGVVYKLIEVKGLQYLLFQDFGKGSGGLWAETIDPKIHKLAFPANNRELHPPGVRYWVQKDTDGSHHLYRSNGHWEEGKYKSSSSEYCHVLSGLGEWKIITNDTHISDIPTRAKDGREAMTTQEAREMDLGVSLSIPKTCICIDNKGLEDCFDINVEYSYEDSKDKDFIRVKDNSGNPHLCSKTRFCFPMPPPKDIPSTRDVDIDVTTMDKQTFDSIISIIKDKKEYSNSDKYTKWINDKYFETKWNSIDKKLTYLYENNYFDDDDK